MNTQSTIPQPGALVFTPDGRFQEIWWRFFLALLNRTGGTQGIDGAQLQAEIDALQEQAQSLFAGQEGQTLAAQIAGLLEEIQGLQMPQEIGMAAIIGGLLATVSSLEARLAEVTPPAVIAQPPIAEAFTHGVYDDPNLHALATPTTAGFMSAADKSKLDSL